MAITQNIIQFPASFCPVCRLPKYEHPDRSPQILVRAPADPISDTCCLSLVVIDHGRLRQPHYVNGFDDTIGGKDMHLFAPYPVFVFMNTNTLKICTTNARQQAQKGALFVDVRESDEVATLAFDAPDVTNLPLSHLAQRWQELPKGRELVTVCFNGDKSQQASEFLLAQGLKNVHPMRGGILLWMQKGYPVIGKRFTNFEK